MRLAVRAHLAAGAATRIVWTSGRRCAGDGSSRKQPAWRGFVNKIAQKQGIPPMFHGTIIQGQVEAHDEQLDAIFVSAIDKFTWHQPT